VASCREADSGRRRTAGRSATRWEISEEVGIFRRDRWKAYETVSGHWNLDTRFGPGLSVEPGASRTRAAECTESRSASVRTSSRRR